jgi:hypothetical protein
MIIARMRLSGALARYSPNSMTASFQRSRVQNNNASLWSSQSPRTTRPAAVATLRTMVDQVAIDELRAGRAPDQDRRAFSATCPEPLEQWLAAVELLARAGGT